MSSVDVGKVRLCVKNRVTSYGEWKEEDEGGHSEELEQYHAWVGQVLAERLVLRWGGRGGGDESDEESD